MDLMEARQLMVSFARPLHGEAVKLEGALGRVLCDPMEAFFPIPGEDRSRYDGYALRSADTASACGQAVPLCLLPEVIAAGRLPQSRVEKGQCARILTGAPLPDGADSVVPQENVSAVKGCVLVDRRLYPGDGVFPKGRDAAPGDGVLSRGDILTPTRLALAASMGREEIRVFRKPRIALLATGDEVRELGETLQGAQTYCNNRLLLGWLTELMGGEPLHLGVASDDPKAIERSLRGLDVELVITTGGIGHGDRDFVLEAWKGLGVETVFRSLNISPGRHSAFGARGAQAWLALPGSPWAAQLIYHELVVPMLHQWLGRDGYHAPAVTAVLGDGLKNRGKEFRAIRGHLELQGRKPCFRPGPGMKAPFFRTMRDSFAYILLTPSMVEVDSFSEVEVRLLDMPLNSYPLWGCP